MPVLTPGAMRLLLASLVLAIHYLGWLRLPAPGPFDGIAVVGFFFLSGYWIARLWAEKYSRLPRPLLTFYISRALRIYPLATLATLAMVAVPHAHPHGMWRVLTNLALFGISLDGGNAINPPVWSLGTEVDAVGTLIAERPPHRTVRAAFPHTAPTSGIDGHDLPYAFQRL